jgi:hypothetical protein
MGFNMKGYSESDSLKKEVVDAALAAILREDKR